MCGESGKRLLVYTGPQFSLQSTLARTSGKKCQGQLDFTNAATNGSCFKRSIIINLLGCDKRMEHVLFIRIYCFQTFLWSLSDFDVSVHEVRQFHNLDMLGSSLIILYIYNFKCFLIMGV